MAARAEPGAQGSSRVIAGFLRTGHFEENFDFPFDLVERVGRSRDLSRMLGDATRAAELQQIVAGHAQALEDPRRATAFYFWANTLIFR